MSRNSSQTVANHALPPISKVLMALTMTVLAWESRYRTRRSLGRLGAHMLRDIGLDSTVAEIEAGKPFWRP